MRFIQHDGDGPKSIRNAFRADPKPEHPKDAWNAFDSRELREHLWFLQFGLCAYCERSLEIGPGTSTIEHIVPKSANPGYTFRYTNLVLCCADPNTCNLHKRGKHFHGFDDTGRWSEGFVAPNQQRCEKSFVYALDGSVVPAETTYKDDTAETIRVLNLDCPPLRSEREGYLLGVSTAIAAMIAQPDAIELFLADELSLGSGKPFYSAKLQCI